MSKPRRAPMTERHFVRAAATLWRHSLDAVVLLPPGASDPLTLAGTGAILWELLEEPTSMGELVAALVARFDTDPDVVEADLLPVLDELVAIGAVTP